MLPKVPPKHPSEYGKRDSTRSNHHRVGRAFGVCCVSKPREQSQGEATKVEVRVKQHRTRSFPSTPAQREGGLAAIRRRARPSFQELLALDLETGNILEL